MNSWKIFHEAQSWPTEHCSWARLLHGDRYEGLLEGHENLGLCALVVGTTTRCRGRHAYPGIGFRSD